MFHHESILPPKKLKKLSQTQDDKKEKKQTIFTRVSSNFFRQII